MADGDARRLGVAAIELVALVILGVVLLAKPVSEHVRQAAEAKVAGAGEGDEAAPGAGGRSAELARGGRP